jgi:hypothetical protein
MKEKRVRKTKWFWPWQDQEEEVWLETMSASGFHLEDVSPLGTYTFKLGPPVDYAYRMDYQESIKDEHQYYQLFKDSGWRHIDTTFGWRYFRKEITNGIIPEIFTDAETKIQKYSRVKAYSITIITVFTPLLCISVSTPQGEGWRWWFELCLNGAILVCYGITLALSAFAYVKIEKRIQDFRSSQLI